jgi:hypothetical protein
MTDPRPTIKEIRTWATTWQAVLGLQQWRITIVDGPTQQPDSRMEVLRSMDYARAEITVAPFLLRAGPPCLLDWRDTIDRHYAEVSLVHELCHLLYRDARRIAIGTTEDQMHRDAHDVLERTWDRMEERHVDDLAHALVKAHPKRKNP